MRWGWLFNRYADPLLKLTREQRKRVQALIDRRLRWRLLLVSALFIVPPALIALRLAWVADDWLAAQLGWSLNAAHLALLGLIIVLVWPWSAFVYGRFYQRPYRAALRE